MSFEIIANFDMKLCGFQPFCLYLGNRYRYEKSENTSEFLDPKNGGLGIGTELISALVKKLAILKTFFQDGRHEKSTFLIKV